MSKVKTTSSTNMFAGAAAVMPYVGRDMKNCVKSHSDLMRYPFFQDISWM